MTTYSTVSTVIAAGQSLSDPVDCAGCTRIAMPPAWTGGAPLTFQHSEDGTVFRDLYCVDPETLLVPGSFSTLPAGARLGASVSFLRVRSGVAMLPVAQEADRQFGFVLEMP